MTYAARTKFFTIVRFQKLHGSVFRSTKVEVMLLSVCRFECRSGESEEGERNHSLLSWYPWQRFHLMHDAKNHQIFSSTFELGILFNAGVISSRVLMLWYHFTSIYDILMLENLHYSYLLNVHFWEILHVKFTKL